MIKCLRKFVYLNSTEAVYLVLTDDADNIVWIRNILKHLQIPQRCMLVYQDSAGADNWISSGCAKLMSRCKLVNIGNAYVMDQVKPATIDVTNVPTADMKSNFLTKKLPPYVL